ncbi:hypothetical protein FHX74_002154 [Friedmanniella endophytica]|uniref:DUF4352 domain-containing protein n=1 Tax=Microlunatus kandeliicorticis TaxID=1759536 RepID=A0A7W3P644_9ACTN|nr:hypothetical protein [Microlunatus kandeliicorticis]MBA8794535.1 hypothetical protein [Microlunatus kandeliicorticis]
MTGARTRARSGWVALVVCVLLALVLTAVTPDPATNVRRDWVDGRVGQSVVEPDLTTTVQQVRLARSASRSYGDPFVSRQRLVLVRLAVDVRHRQRLFSRVTLLTTTGLSYEPRDEFVSQGLSTTQAGFTRTATMVFEVPPEHVPGSRLVIDADGGAFDFYTRATRVDLGLTAATAIDPGAVRVPDSTVRVTG